MPKNNFKRRFELIKELQREPLFQECLLDDIKNGEVFPAVRNGYIDFYYKGGRLFNYKGIFKTHRKYLSLIKSKKDYLSENDIKNIEKVNNFLEQYGEIKKNCEIYSEEESKGVSYLYSKNSFINSEKNVVVLDIEICFDVYKEEAELDTKEKKLDRIDILLYSKKDKKLQFVEAKHFSNKDLWSETKPKVITQINRYNKQIQNRYDEILETYKKYVDIIKELFEKLIKLNLPKPEKIEPSCGLYVFGFSDDEKKGKLQESLVQDKRFISVKCYPLGNPKGINAETLWNKVV